MSKHKIIVIGDIMLDEYLRLRPKGGSLERGFSNNPVPQYDIVGILKRFGGAYNVAYLLHERLQNNEVQMYGAFPSGLDDLVNESFGDCDPGNYMFRSPAGKFPVKRRYIDSESNYAHARHDYFKPMGKCEDKDVLDWVRNIPFHEADLVVISDYMKGLLSKNVVSHIIANSKIVVVDTKNPDLDIFIGANYIKLNESEHLNIIKTYGDDADEKFAPHNIILTRADKGTLFLSANLQKDDTPLYQAEVPIRHIDTESIVDTVGSGDAFVAGFAWGLLEHNEDVMKAIEEGHWLASVSLGKLGAQW